MSNVLGPIGSPSGGVSTDTSRLANKENLEAAGQRFEAVFTGMMLKSMRQAKLGDGLFDSKGEDQFRDMQDQQLAQSMAVHAPIGIGKAMTAFLAKSMKTETAAEPGTAPTATEGGTVK
ncbi:rod-binding protein [Sphingomonas sp. NIBR02145]|uniref:rod-binding protein n=1 Tax=Sphingomonas sp. NIBR02145 TaxID=3014784 RepID=UPI0022B33656|nr:rod-binding protein [Sphingomonas sp. NIBR02145]WHU01654.1 rod-binding protein [Sphingomonas sp. NIBR02145]